MPGGMPRKKGKRKRSVNSDDEQMSFSSGANAYGVRYGPSLSNISSRCRLSRSATRGVASTNATVNLTRRGFSLCVSSGVHQNDENIEGLLHQKWNVYSASAFTSFDSSVDQLKNYSFKLNKILSYKLHKPDINEIYNSELNFSAGFPSVLTIEVFSSCKMKYATRSKNSSRELLQNSVFMAQFFSWDEKKINIDDEEMPENSSVLYMPLLLCRSSNGAHFIETVNNCLKTLFDINISKTYMSQEDMSWLINLASSDLDALPTEPSASAQAHFFYDLPRNSLLNCQPHMAISFEVKSVFQLWHCVHRSLGGDSEITYEEVLSFMRCLEEHCLCAYKINFSECCLVKFVIPSASVSLNGMIKITSLTAAGRILRFLADKCSLGNSLVPSLGFSMTL